MEGEESGRFDEPCRHCCCRVQRHCRPRYHVTIVTILNSQPLPIIITIAIKVTGINWGDSDVGGHGFSETGALRWDSGMRRAKGERGWESVGLRIVGLRPQNYLHDNN